jgi:predicted nucleic acid-binding protein
MPSYLVDTNVLLRLSTDKHPQHAIAAKAIDLLVNQDQDLFFTLQNASEFWNVCTRPTSLNGLGLSVAEAKHELSAIEQGLTLLPDNILVYDHWRLLIVQHDVRGVQVHDAKLAAVMLAHGVSHLLPSTLPISQDTRALKQFTLRTSNPDHAC